MNELPSGWTYTTIDAVAAQKKNAIKAGPFGSALKKEYYVPSGFKIYGQEQVLRGDPTYGDYYISRERYETLRSCAVEPRDILLSLVGTIGRALILPQNAEPGIINPRLVKITLDERAMLPEYFTYLLQSPRIRASLKLAAHGGTMDVINLTVLRRLQLPLPPRPEQERIVAAIEEQFSRLDAGTTSLHRAQQNLKRARKAVLDAAVNGRLIGNGNNCWDELALGDLLDDIHAGRSFKCDERPAGLHEWGVVKVSAMTWGRFLENENKTVIDDQRVDSRFEIHPGDLLVSRANTVEYVGAVVLVSQCRPRLLLSDKSLRLVPNSKVLPEWLMISLRASSARRYIESVATGTSDSMRNISQPKLKELRIALPPIDVQSEIAGEVDRMMSQIDRLDEALRDSQHSAQALRSSILAAAFSGELS